MATSLDDVVICIPTKRPPPVLTLESYVVPDGVPVFIIADPSLFVHHRRYYAKEIAHDRIRVIKGESTWAGQVMRTYREARIAGYRYFFRLDDDLPPKTFIKKDRSHPTLEQVMRWARKCIKKTKTSLAGFCNTSRIDWLGHGYGRSYALVHGGAHICESLDEREMMHPKLPRYEDVYRSCAHRRRDGAVGRVKFVGLDKSASQQKTAGGSTLEISMKKRRRAIKIILKEFPDFVRYLGEKEMKGGKTYPIFRYRRHEGYRA